MSKTIYKGPIFTLEQRQVTIHGKEYNRDIIRHPGGVGVLLVVNQQILLVKQIRHAIDKETLEIPAGKLEYNEDIKEAAFRELNEEAGYTCEKLELFQAFVSTPGFCDEKIYLFEAIHPSKASVQLAMDEDEDITKVWIDIDTAYQYTQDGTIEDAKTILAIYRAYYKERRK